MTKSPPARRRRCRPTLDVLVKVPKHSSSVEEWVKKRNDSAAHCLFLYCHQPGVLWQGLYPMLFESAYVDRRIPRRLVKILFAESWKNSTSFQDTLKEYLKQPQKQQNDDDDDDPSFHSRNLRIATTRHSQQIQLYILPPSYETFLDRTFTAVVLEHERTLLKKQTMTAWMATLGGGYFFIKQLSKSLQLARQQRYLALQIGNEAMARTCLLNEAYNLIYAGQFPAAKQVLTTLENQVMNANSSNGNSATSVLEEHEVQRTLRQCHAARILLRRLKKLRTRLKGYHSTETHTVDDFQRVRIVEEV